MSNYPVLAVDPSEVVRASNCNGRIAKLFHSDGEPLGLPLVLTPLRPSASFDLGHPFGRTAPSFERAPLRVVPRLGSLRPLGRVRSEAVSAFFRSALFQGTGVLAGETILL